MIRRKIKSRNRIRSKMKRRIRTSSVVIAANL